MRRIASYLAACVWGYNINALFRYFREQHTIMENAISQIKESISGNKDVTIECNDEANYTDCSMK